MCAVKANAVKLPTFRDWSPTLGCDPEFFFKIDGQVVGAEKVLPKHGLMANKENLQSKFIIDGVQAELNPRPNFCRANLGNEIRACFTNLQAELKKKGGNITADFGQAIEISKEQLMELDEASRKFGCAPSKTIYRNKAAMNIKEVDPTEYRVRAAGGHIHFGLKDNLFAHALVEPKDTVEMLDIICGNTCVLIDRDPANIERRKVYGRAGEYRLPTHGLEYRTLSNFWLTSYPLMSMAFGLARMAVNTQVDAKTAKLFHDAFTTSVKRKNIRDAINNNDYDLAMENFERIKKLFLEIQPYDGGRIPITKSNINEFLFFAEDVKNNGIKKWFPKDPMEHWTTVPECHTGGFYDFLVNDVRKGMQTTQANAATGKVA